MNQGTESRSTKRLPPRTDEQVPIVRDTPMVPFAFPWQIRPPAHNLVVMVKATFDLVDGQAAKLCEDQSPPSGDLRWDGEEKASLRYPSDFVVYKPKADVMLVGHAYPGDNPAVAAVTLQVGRLQRTIAAFGDRSWGTFGAQSKPSPFDRMPLRWERAMGGPLSDANPVGRGFKTGVILPNLERREALVGSPRDVPAPACLGPVAPEWKARASKLGSFGGRWLKDRWPYFPEDFDFSYFNAAPAEQQVPYLRGDEAYVLHGVQPRKTVLSGSLPGIVPRVFAALTLQGANSFVEVSLNLDTVWFDSDNRKLALVWRGLLVVQDDEASEVAALFVTSTKVGESITQQEAFERFLLAGTEAGLLAEPECEDDGPLAVDPTPSMLAAPPPSRTQVVGWLETKTPLSGKDLGNVDLSGLDFRGVDLSGAILTGARLEGARFEGANLSDAVLARAHAPGARFDACELSGADLTLATLVGTTFAKAKMAGAIFWQADATGAVFSDTEAPGAVFAKAILTNCTFERAQLPKSDFTQTILNNSRWSEASLDNARFYGASGTSCTFEGASLTNARMDDAVLQEADFRLMRADESVWERANITGSSLHGAKVNRANFTRAKLDRCVLSAAEGKGAFFRKASLRGASMLKSNLMQSSFEGADLTDADLRGANLYQVETWRSETTGAKLDLALVAGSKLAR